MSIQQIIECRFEPRPRQELLLLHPDGIRLRLLLLSIVVVPGGFGEPLGPLIDGRGGGAFRPEPRVVGGGLVSLYPSASRNKLA